MKENNFVNKLSIKLKIALGFGILITLFVLEFLFSAMALNRIDERVNSLSNYSEISAKILQKIWMTTL
jgi:CHASE3 domain sensor protein